MKRIVMTILALMFTFSSSAAAMDDTCQGMCASDTSESAALDQ